MHGWHFGLHACLVCLHVCMCACTRTLVCLREMVVALPRVAAPCHSLNQMSPRRGPPSVDLATPAPTIRGQRQPLHTSCSLQHPWHADIESAERGGYRSGTHTAIGGRCPSANAWTNRAIMGSRKGGTWPLVRAHECIIGPSLPRGQACAVFVRWVNAYVKSFLKRATAAAP